MGHTDYGVRQDTLALYASQGWVSFALQLPRRVFVLHCHMALWAQVLSYMEGKSPKILPLTISGKYKFSELQFLHLLTGAGNTCPGYFMGFRENPKAF